MGATTSAEAFLNWDTLKIVALGLIAFAFGTAAGVLFGKIMCSLRKALSAFVTETQQTVTGKVRLKLYKGNIINSGVWSPYSLYSEDIVTFNEGEGYQQSDATGFIRLLGLPTRIQASVNARNRREAEKC